MCPGELQLASNMQAESDNDKHASHPKMKVIIIITIMMCFIAHFVQYLYYVTW